MKRRATALIAGAVILVALIVPATAAAHGIGGIRDLPVPGWLFLFGGATVLIVSFLALGVLWKTPTRCERGHAAARRAPVGPPRAIRPDRRERAVAGALRARVERRGVRLRPRPAPTSRRRSSTSSSGWGSVPSVILGNVWSVLDPWRAVGRPRRLVVGPKLGVATHRRPYPGGSGSGRRCCCWLFTVLELVYRTRRIRASWRWPSFSTASRRGRGWSSSAGGTGAQMATGSPSTSASSRGSRSSGPGTRRSQGARPSPAAFRLAVSSAGRRRGVPRGDARLGGLRRALPLELVARPIYDVQSRFSDPVEAERVMMLFNLSG